MEISTTHKSVLVGLFVVVSLATTFVLTLATYDYSTYKTDFHQLHQFEKDTLVSELTKSKASAEELLALIRSRFEVSDGNSERLQRILSSVGQLAAQLELPLVLRAKYEKFSEPGLKITRFGVKPLQEGAGETDYYGPKVVFDDDVFIARQAVLNTNNEIDGVLVLTFDAFQIKKSFETLVPKQTFPEYEQVGIEGMTFYAKPSLTFWVHTAQNLNRYVGFWVFAALTMLFVGGLYAYLRRHFDRQYGEKMTRLKKEVASFVESEFEHQSYRTGSKELQRIQSLISSQQRSQMEHLHVFLSHFVDTHQDPNSFISDEQRHLLNSCLVSLDSLSTGLCSPLHKRDVSVLGILETIGELFAAKIHTSEITFEIDCHESLTIQGDSTYLYMIFLNVIGRSLYRVYSMGKVFVYVSPQETSVELIVTDSGEAPSHSIEKMIQDSFPLFIENSALGSLCKQADILIRRERNPNQNVTTVTIPILSAEGIPDNVVPLFH